MNDAATAAASGTCSVWALSPERSCQAFTTQLPAGTPGIAKLPSAETRAQKGLSRTSTKPLICGWMLQ